MKEFVIIGSGFGCSLSTFNKLMKLMNQIFLWETVKCKVGVLVDTSSAVLFIGKLYCAFYCLYFRDDNNNCDGSLGANRY